MARQKALRMPLLLLVLQSCLAIRFKIAHGDTNPQDVAALRLLMANWQNSALNWGQTNDPCGTPWDGVRCDKSRVTELKLSTMGLEGTLSGDISLLDQLQILDLSYNKKLGGSLTPNIENLKQLNTLILAGCGFTGTIPSELGTLRSLTFLALNSNKFSGSIPASLGGLSELLWLDIADNSLSGTLPVSSGSTPGLDNLFKTNHFHFNKNQLSGTIPPQIFNANMTLLHVLFDGNQLNGTIPETIGQLAKLEVLRLDKNQLSGTVPSSISNLTRVGELNLANNRLNGAMPDLSGMSRLNYLDLSNNSFDASESPSWFTKMQSLTTLAVESTGLRGQLPKELFSIPQLQQVIMKNNSYNGTIDLSGSISPQLQLVNLQNNNVTSVNLGGGNKITLILVGNPACSNLQSGAVYCSPQQAPPYSTSLSNCGSTSCSQDQDINPSNCVCSYPYKGTLVFRAPSFSDLTNSTRFKSLETSLWERLGLASNSVSLRGLQFDIDNYLQMQLSLFPSGGIYFNRSEIQRIGFYLSKQIYKPPTEFGPLLFDGSEYAFPGASSAKSKVKTGIVAGIAVGCALLIIGLIAMGTYAFQQKKKAKRAEMLTRPFASWAPTGNDTGGAPQLKGARWFSFDEIKKCTRNFSNSNEIGSGGYGRVYKGILSDGQIVAIKRSQQGSMQGGLEFKTEIELLSRVHHKNLVGLVGFCFDQGEQMLVYEYISNGTLRESLAGTSGITLDWKRRLKIALGSARGLAYLHELANPPIIHRDVKTSNILLDENSTAKVADFGLSKLVSDGEKGHVTTQVKGTMGYLDPEYYMTQQLTEKSDVYSFGVVMLELITAKLPIEKGKYIVREVRNLLNQNDEYCGLWNIIDPSIRSTPNLIGFGRFVELALQCVEESASGRPTMNDIVKEIEILLQNEGSNVTSASTSATDFGKGKGAPQHLYSEPLAGNDTSDSAFDNSMSHPFSYKVEPK